MRNLFACKYTGGEEPAEAGKWRKQWRVCYEQVTTVVNQAQSHQGPCEWLSRTHNTPQNCPSEGGCSWGVHQLTPSLIVKGDSGAMTLQWRLPACPMPRRSSLAGPDALRLRAHILEPSASDLLAWAKEYEPGRDIGDYRDTTQVLEYFDSLVHPERTKAKWTQPRTSPELSSGEGYGVIFPGNSTQSLSNSTTTLHNIKIPFWWVFSSTFLFNRERE